MSTTSGRTLSSIVRSVGTLPERFIGALRPQRLPDFLKAQAGSFDSVLPYEAFLSLDRPTCLLSDGSLGVAWDLTPMPHEVMSHSEIERRIGTVAEIVEKVRAADVTFQFLFDAEPSDEIPTPENLKAPRSSAEKGERA
jgi:hypothetical protein